MCIQQLLATGSWPNRLVRCLGAALAGLIFSQGALAVGPALEHYNHTVWTAKEGVPGPIEVMAQTPDGWLWIGTPNGLYRFDGVRFHPLATTNGERLLSNRLDLLTAEPNGDLYIGYEDHGLSVLHADGRLEHLAPATRNSPVAGSNALVRDIDGALWVGTVRGLMRLEQGRWSRIGAAHGYPDEFTPLVTLDGNGRLWAATLTRLFRYDREARRFVPVDLPPPNPGEPTERFLALAMSPDGRLWSAEDGRFIPVPAAPPANGRPADANSRDASYYGLFDRDGHLWSLRCPVGVCLAAGAGAGRAERIDVAAVTTSRLDQPWQLNSVAPNLILEDREGNIWISSANGLERFRKNALTPVALPPTNGNYHLAPDTDGSVWVVAPRNKRGWHYDPASRRLTELPGNYRGAARSADGSVVLLKEDGIRRRRAGVEDQIALPTLPPGAWLRTDGDRLWLGGRNTPVRIWDGHNWDTLEYPKPDEFTFSAAGAHGQMWRGLVDGRLLLYERGRRTREFDQAALGGIGQATCLAALPAMVVCGEAGVSAWDGRRFRRLQASRPEVLRNVTGVMATADGTRWLNGSVGLLRVAPADWRRSVESGALLRFTLLDALDGYPGSAAHQPSMTMVGKHLWVAASGGIVEIDPSTRDRNLIAPHVALLGLRGDGAAYPLLAPRIRPGTTRLRFDFTAPVLRKPERVVFSYRLDGVDDAWQTGPERSATYTGLPPGAYVFRVRAMNEDGVWSQGERTLAFEVAPTLVQTIYFKLTCGLAALLLLWLGHRLRLRYLTRSLNRHYQVQLEERARIARELHDSLLQSFQSAVLFMNAALRGLGPESPLHERLKRGVREADAAIVEGRGKVAALRAVGAGQPSLPDYLREVGEREAAPEQHFALQVKGLACPLQPVVEQELSAIGREALRNAFRHAGASRHEVLIEYGARSLVLSVRDNGRGIDAGARDKPDHWGLCGIEERARMIHAEASLHTAPGSGTLWRIEIKAGLAYAEGGRRRRRRWWLMPF
ncbi:sensor histidine kinase [Pseudoduganella umbonata]|nr:sensor histidine kinase [Pseudoduganella umbonata]MBB3220541.1 signal transduction histidine kinase/ligand-binding sensor domain-containing protein [Pseudoduganella umbonata]